MQLHSTQSKQYHLLNKDVPAQDFIRAHVEVASIVKNDLGQEISPINQDWMYIRAASLASKVYVRSHWGIEYLTHMFGSVNDNCKHESAS